MTIEESKNLLIELVDLEVKEREYKKLLGYAYTEISENDKIKMESEIPILERKIKEIRIRLDSTTME